MNIQKLLKKLDKKCFDSKKQLLTVQCAYKLKTSESIGTLNSIADQNQRSFVISEAITPQNKKIISEGISANSKLDQQLINIEKMKNLYQSRQIKNRGRTKSIQKNSASGQKSLEKHLLKPSNTPSFNKIQKVKIRKQQDSACKNLYTEQMLQNSQISRVSQISNKPINQKNTKNNMYQFPDSILHVQDHQQLPYQQQPTYNQQNISQIASISQDILQNFNAVSLQKQIPNNIDKIWNKNSNYKQKDNYEQVYHYNCVSRSELECLMSGLQNKINLLNKKVNQLQKQNQNIKNLQTSLLNQNKKLQSALQYSKDQKQTIYSQLKKKSQEKQELEVILKDVLYQRQREKLQSSKQNTYRQNQKNQKRLNNYSYHQSQSTTQIKPPIYNGNSQTRQSESKMKVQNLLHKLQIKVDRT